MSALSASIERHFRRAAVLVLVALSSAQADDTVSPFTVDRVERFTLENGLRVVVQTDARAPVVAISMLYRVGSRHERAGRSGFAHLFEHLMFSGTQHFDEPFQKAFASAGASIANAATWWDHTLFYETVPRNALEFALFLESERMGYLAPALTEEKLRSEVSVVQNEKRQKDNRPFGSVEYAILDAVFPEGHPYAWSPLGTLGDLEAAQVEDVRAWADRHYRPDNAVLVLAGDIEVGEARGLVERYFGHFEPGGPRVELEIWVPEASTRISETQQENAPNHRFYRAWAGPGRTSRERSELDLVTAWLGGGSDSYLARRLVNEGGLANFVNLSLIPGELASLLLLTVDAVADADPAEVEAAIDEALADARTAVPDPEAWQVARTQLRSRLLRELDTLGGPGGRSVNLALGELYFGDPQGVAKRAAWIEALAREQSPSLVSRWLHPDGYRLHVEPFRARAVPGEGIDRSVVPPIGIAPAPAFPDVRVHELPNGVEVLTAPREGGKFTHLALLTVLGYERDPVGREGLGAVSLEALLDAEPVGARAALAALGGIVTVHSHPGVASIEIEVPFAEAAEAIDLLGQMLTEANVNEASLVAARQSVGRQAVRAWSAPRTIATQVLRAVTLGGGYSDRNANTGHGMRASVEGIAIDDVRRHLDATLGPGNARVVIVGPRERELLESRASASLGAWRGEGGSDVDESRAPVGAPTARVWVVDRPGSQQTAIAFGSWVRDVDASGLAAHEVALDLVRRERLLSNLREEKGWTYGIGGSIDSAREGSSLSIVLAVQTDRTIEALEEIRREMAAVTGADRPVEPAEVERLVAERRASLAGRFESGSAVLQQIVENLRLARPMDHVVTQAERYGALTVADVQAAADGLFGRHLTWVLVGDAASFADRLERLGIGPVEYVEVPE